MTLLTNVLASLVSRGFDCSPWVTLNSFASRYSFITCTVIFIFRSLLKAFLIAKQLTISGLHDRDRGFQFFLVFELLGNSVDGHLVDVLLGNVGSFVACARENGDFTSQHILETLLCKMEKLFQ